MSAGSRAAPRCTTSIGAEVSGNACTMRSGSFSRAGVRSRRRGTRGLPGGGAGAWMSSAPQRAPSRVTGPAARAPPAAEGRSGGPRAPAIRAPAANHGCRDRRRYRSATISGLTPAKALIDAWLRARAGRASRRRILRLPPSTWTRCPAAQETPPSSAVWRLPLRVPGPAGVTSAIFIH